MTYDLVSVTYSEESRNVLHVTTYILFIFGPCDVYTAIDYLTAHLYYSNSYLILSCFFFFLRGFVRRWRRCDYSTCCVNVIDKKTNVLIWFASSTSSAYLLFQYIATLIYCLYTDIILLNPRNFAFVYILMNASRYRTILV